MGKGDKKSKRGKLFMGSYGVRRPKKKKNAITKVVEITPKPVEEKKVKKTTKKKAASASTDAS